MKLWSRTCGSACGGHPGTQSNPKWGEKKGSRGSCSLIRFGSQQFGSANSSFPVRFLTVPEPRFDSIRRLTVFCWCFFHNDKSLNPYKSTITVYKTINGFDAFFELFNPQLLRSHWLSWLGFSSWISANCWITREYGFLQVCLPR